MTKATEYISDLNYNPGRKPIPAGAIFNLDRWKECGGSEEGLQGHLDAGYIRVWEGQEPPKAVPAPIEETVDEEPPQVRSQGLWNFTKEELDGLPLDALNLLYKDRASEFGKTVRAYKDRDALVKKLTSDNED